jgi:hypothetical protein
MLSAACRISGGFEFEKEKRLEYDGLAKLYTRRCELNGEDGQRQLGADVGG